MGLQVIGGGFGRTGTMSLKAALEQLGLGPCYHMVECLPKGPAHWGLWVDAARGTPNWKSIFNEYNSTVDFPSSVFTVELAADFPDAKVVLTHRDPERWFESTQETIFAPHWIEYLSTVEMGAFMGATINRYLNDRMHDREHLIRRFNEHFDAVRQAIPAERLLIFQASDGWDPLCEFLECPVPDSPYPFINDTEMTKAFINAVVEHGLEEAMQMMGG
ncbi:MAG: sulfotransferase family protein [Planctomycetota bacterium]